jgi:hypothetical protein
MCVLSNPPRIHPSLPFKDYLIDCCCCCILATRKSYPANDVRGLRLGSLSSQFGVSARTPCYPDVNVAFPKWPWKPIIWSTAIRGDSGGCWMCVCACVLSRDCSLCGCLLSRTHVDAVNRITRKVMFMSSV